MQPTDYRATLDLCAYPGFSFVLGADRGGSDWWLQVECYEGTDNVTGKPMTWKGRKWRLSSHMTKSEIVQTAFKAVMTAMEHETREKFTYRGATIFDPHYDVDRLHALRSDPAAIDHRA